MATNAKHNQHGRLDEHGIMRHSDVQVCAVGALAFLLWATFHVTNFTPAADEFTSNFASTNSGPFGERRWYAYHVFFGTKPEVKMTYEL